VPWQEDDTAEDSLTSDFNQYHEPGGSPAGGQFASAPGGGGGQQAPKQKELFQNLPVHMSPAAEAATKGKIEGAADFQKAGIELIGRMGAKFETNSGKKFKEHWENSVKVAPEEFKKEFLGNVKATMKIDYLDSQDMMEIAGNILDEQNKSIGEYRRSIDFAANKAESAYFKIYDEDTGKGVGKEMLAHNVAFYQKMGLDSVEVHANIDVGGYAWAKYGYVPTQDSWDTLRDDLREKGGGSGEVYQPESWDELSDDEQENAASQWRENTYDDFESSVQEDWQESGQALAASKVALAKPEEWARGHRDWAVEAVDEWLKGKEDIKATAEQLIVGMSIDYEDSRGDGENDPQIGLNFRALEDLSDDRRRDLESRLVEAFNARASELAPHMEVKNLERRIRDVQEEHWDNMRARDKFGYASRYGVIEEREPEFDTITARRPELTWTSRGGQ
jgi:hypothetical protein